MIEVVERRCREIRELRTALRMALDVDILRSDPACDSIDGFHKLDFRVGEWSVTNEAGDKQGDNRIERP